MDVLKIVTQIILQMTPLKKLYAVKMVKSPEKSLKDFITEKNGLAPQEMAKRFKKSGQKEKEKSLIAKMNHLAVFFFTTNIIRVNYTPLH